MGNVDFVTGAYSKSVKRDYSLHAVTGITKITELEFKLYPNPTSDVVTIELPENSLKNAEISVLDLNNRLIFRLPKTNFMIAGNQCSFSVNNLPKGVYLVQVKKNGTLLRKKLLVQ